MCIIVLTNNNTSTCAPQFLPIITLIQVLFLPIATQISTRVLSNNKLGIRSLKFFTVITLVYMHWFFTVITLVYMHWFFAVITLVYMHWFFTVITLVYMHWFFTVITLVYMHWFFTVITLVYMHWFFTIMF